VAGAEAIAVVAAAAGVAVEDLVEAGVVAVGLVDLVVDRAAGAELLAVGEMFFSDFAYMKVSGFVLQP
jgi:hypothetical protein